MLPRILVIDDLFGRGLAGGRNIDRENLCAQFLWRDVTDDEAAKANRQRVIEPRADVIFTRGQAPAAAGVGDVVENDLAGAMAVVRKGWTDALARGELPWSMVLLDLCFYTGRVTEESHRRTPGVPAGRPGDDDPGCYFGLTLLDALHRDFSELPVFVLSSKPRHEVSLEFSRRGALGFIDRGSQDAPDVLDSAIANHGLLPDSTGAIIGHSLPILLALREARRIARHAGNVLIRGERGTGKELFAKYLNRMAPSSNGARPLVSVNSAAFAPNLFASELFGIEPRTATGVDGKVGLIESAAGGDLFLDEIGDMPADVQASLLRVLQDRQVTRVGGRRSMDVNVRFVSATNLDLEDGERRFRADLLDRLRTGGTVRLHPLRERRGDIPLLVRSFVDEAVSQHSGARSRSVTNEAMEVLLEHDWPGSVRELRSTIQDAVVRHPDVEYLVPSHLRFASRGEGKRLPVPRATTEQVWATSNRLEVVLQGMRDASINANNVSDWAGRLNEVQREQARLLARMLLAALQCTRRITPASPTGELQVHPAVKLLTGDSTITASKAADLIKRLLGPIEDELTGDLMAAHRIALRLRPRSPRSEVHRRTRGASGAT